MLKLYKLDELEQISSKGYARAITKYSEEVGASSFKALIMYSNQAGWYYDIDGNRWYKK